MRNKILTFFMACSIFLASNLVVTKNAEALVGLAFRSKVVQVIGGIGVVGGAALFTSGYVAGATATNLGGIVWLVVGATYGVAIGGLGLIILDDNTVVDLEYQKIDESSADFSKYSQLEIDIYNAELEELNAIRKTIQLEVPADNKNFDQAASLWKEYSQVLSPETVMIAQDKAVEFINALK